MFRMKNKAMSGLESDKLKKNVGTYAILLTALGAMAFFGVCDPTGRKFGGRFAGAKGSAATVGREVITRTEFLRAYQREYQQYQRMYQDAFNPAQLRLAHSVMRQLVDERAMYQKANELGLRASDDEILQMLAREESFKGEDGKFSDEIFNRFLEGNGYNEAQFMEEVRRSVTLQKLRRLVADTAFVSSKQAELDYRAQETKIDVDYLKFDPQKADVQIGAAEIDKFLQDEKGKARVKEYYEQNSREFNQQGQVKARHILVAYKGARNATPEAQKRDKTAARQRADQLLAKVKAPGADFAKLAKDATDEPSGKASGGDLGFFTRETMDKAFSDAAFALEKGQISSVVETPFGFHIIQVEDKKPALSTKLEGAQRKIAETLLAKEKRPEVAKQQATKALEALKAGKPEAQLLQEAKVAWQSTGETGADARFLPGIGQSKEAGEALLSLNKPGQLYPALVDVRGNLYILRLKSRKDADLSKLDKDKKRELALMDSYQTGQSLYQAYEKQVLGEMEKKKSYWENPEYLAMDSAKDSEESGG